jgi:hypothetical protein
MRNRTLIFIISICLISCTKEIIQQKLTVSVTPANGGTVSPPSNSYEKGSNVSLVATPSGEYLFKQWQGSISGTSNPTSITMDADKSVTGVFEKRQYPLTLTIEGSGTVKEEVIAVATQALYPSGTTVRLTAQPVDKFEFGGWSGDLTSTANPLDLKIDKAISLKATFKKIDLLYKFNNPDFVYIGEFNNKKYFLSKYRDSWINAFKFTLGNDNLSLAIIEDTQTKEFLKSNILSNLNKVVDYTNEPIIHIGLSYNKADSKFYWQNGKPFLNTDWFNPGHPEQNTLKNNTNIGAFWTLHYYAAGISESYDLASWWYVIEEYPYNSPPPVDFSVKPFSYFNIKSDNGCYAANTALSFNNQSLRGEKYTWTFSDGQTSTEKNPIKTFNGLKPIKITLTTTNSGGSNSYESFINFNCPITYKTFQNNTVKGYIWNGKKVSILTQRNDLDPEIMNNWLNYLDLANEFYFNATNRVLGNSSLKEAGSNQLIAVVNATCGAGCGYLGANGIEYLNYFFDFDYDFIKRDGAVNHIPFYEMGRNFWGYSEKLTYGSYGIESMVTGFAVYMRFKSMEYAKLKPSTFDGFDFDFYKTNVKNMVGVYLNNNALTFENTFGVNKGFAVGGQNLSSADLFASFCLKIESEYSKPDFSTIIWKEVAKRPNVANRQDAIDNFILASCATLNKNIVSKFIEWKFPVSNNAINEAKKYN